MDGVADLERPLQGRQAHLHHAAVQFRHAAVEDAVHHQHERRHAAFLGGAEGHDFVAQANAEIGGQ